MKACFTLSATLASNQDFPHNCDLSLNVHFAEEWLETGHPGSLIQRCNCVCSMAACGGMCSIVQQCSVLCVNNNGVINLQK